MTARVLRVYGRTLAGLAAERRRVGLLVAANLAVATLQFVDPLLFGRVVQTLAADAPGGTAALLGLWALAGAAGIAASLVSALNAERLSHRGRLEAMRRFYEHVLALPPAFHGKAQTGRLMKVMLSGADGLAWLWLSFFREQLATFTAVAVLLPLTVLLNWRLALVLIALVAAFTAMTALLIHRTETGQRSAQRYQIQLASAAQDALANVVLVQSYARLAAEARLFGDIMHKVIAHQFPVLNWWAVFYVLTRAASTIAVIAVVAIGAALHAHGVAGVGDIVGFMGLAVLLVGRLEGAMGFLARLIFEAPALAEYFAVLDERSSLPEARDARPLGPAPDGSVGAVRFERVSFAYPAGPAVLDGVDFAVRPGTVVALVGPTGAGKSTATGLLQRLWDPSGGRVLVDEQDLRSVTLESLRRMVGVVFQEAMLLNRSIRDNVLIGRPGATQAELEEACRQAEAHEFILRQPAGYDTLVGERGATLSGGQRQRIAIARALLKDPPILILDEATSALDAATESRVNAALRALMRGRTTLIVAHRLSTVRDADEILVFEAGRIVERGGFADLIAAGGRFAALVEAQLSVSAAVQ